MGKGQRAKGKGQTGTVSVMLGGGEIQVTMFAEAKNWKGLGHNGPSRVQFKLGGHVKEGEFAEASASGKAVFPVAENTSMRLSGALSASRDQSQAVVPKGPADWDYQLAVGLRHEANEDLVLQGEAYLKDAGDQLSVGGKGGVQYDTQVAGSPASTSLRGGLERTLRGQEVQTGGFIELNLKVHFN